MRRGPRGFTLLEVAVAIAILGIGVVTLQQIFQGALRLQDRASRQGRAVLHARAKMDAMLLERHIHDHEPSCETTLEGFRTCDSVRHATPEEGGEQEREFDLESAQGLRYVEVEVTWSDGRGAKAYTLRTLRMAPEDEE